MKKLAKIGLLALILGSAGTIFFSGILQADEENGGKLPFALNPCTDQETWSWSNHQSQFARGSIQEFENLIGGKSSPVRGFAEALALRQLSKSSESRALSEYWLSRSLLASGLYHLAHQGFHALIAKETDQATAPYQLAALGCLNVIRQAQSALSLEEVAIRQITVLNDAAKKMYSAPSPYLKIILEADFHLAREHFNSPVSDLALKLLKGNIAHETLTRAFIESAKHNPKETVKLLDQFFAFADLPKLSPLLLDETHLIYGRALYEMGRYDSAAVQFKSISTRSNEWVHALSELSWVYLMDEKYRESIGAGLGLQSGNFRSTFAPEVLMVMAIALNEICRFPESMNMIQAFRKNYHPAYNWLKSHSTASETPKFYKLAVDFMRKTTNSELPPVNVVSEWIRSPVFLSNQERLNLLIRERNLTNELSEQGKNEQRQAALNLIKKAKEIRKKLSLEKINLKPGEELSAELLADLISLREDRIHFQRLRRAGGVWRVILSRYLKGVPATQAKITSTISKEFARLNTRMLTQLEEIAENNELIEVEIFNEASEDMIWQNAHPDYKELAKSIKQSSIREEAAKVWNWGTTKGGLDGRGEIWEDEVGSLTADLTDNCDNKDKYLALKGK